MISQKIASRSGPVCRPEGCFVIVPSLSIVSGAKITFFILPGRWSLIWQALLELNRFVRNSMTPSGVSNTNPVRPFSLKVLFVTVRSNRFIRANPQCKLIPDQLLLKVVLSIVIVPSPGELTLRPSPTEVGLPLLSAWLFLSISEVVS